MDGFYTSVARIDIFQLVTYKPVVVELCSMIYNILHVTNYIAEKY